MTRLAIVSPCYNEQEVLRISVERRPLYNVQDILD